MDWSSQRDIRELLSGLRFCLKALEPPRAMVMVMHGKDATKEIAEDLRQQIAYLEQLIIPKRD